MTQIDKHIISEVQELLQVESNEPEILYDLLYDYRKIVHPDKYSAASAKKEAEEKFKLIGNLLERLSNHIEKSTLQKRPSELIQYQERHQLVLSRKESIEKDRTIEDLRTRLSLAKHDIKNLRGQIKELNSRITNELLDELIGMYKPKLQRRFGSAALVLLSASYLIIGRINEIRKAIDTYSPVDPKILDYITFFAFSFTLIGSVKSYYESRYANELSEKVKDPLFAKAFFVEFIKDKPKKEREFGESDIQAYIIKWLTPKKAFLKYVVKALTKLNDASFVNNLKNQMISTLISKQVIEISHARSMDRMFRATGMYIFTNTDETDDESEDES